MHTRNPGRTVRRAFEEGEGDVTEAATRTVIGERSHRPSVSVVIPVRDDGDRLARCLAALAGQTRRPDEIVVVDNLSSDDTARVAASAGARVVPCRELGIPAASSTGYDAATGDLLLRLDADCLPSPEWVERVLDAFADGPHVDAITGGARFLDGPPSLRVPLAAVYLAAYAALTVPALGHVPLFGSNFAMTREAWRSVSATVHRHDAEVHDDLDLAFHLGEHHTIRYRRGLSMGMSMRPFESASSFAHRAARGFHTVTVHWPRDFPPWRWLRRLVGAPARGRRTSSVAASDGRGPP
ncbi:glycosyltransferase family 2 protein [Microbacterium sp. CFBP9034]|uniref:glycosyltransferase family A protein n=1 Tax=Microbacterium sp. CFBP9034 TaxID=3096540 RepID=UPI002A6B3318|nr:glycosyltransferase family 2 protein [Microbacterium sp. CFBP9034]MDY0908584.1 glycosyltransferase family 2 protein [Microbacterium sp. CFBP9034]